VPGILPRQETAEPPSMQPLVPIQPEQKPEQK